MAARRLIFIPSPENKRIEVLVENQRALSDGALLKEAIMPILQSLQEGNCNGAKFRFAPLSFC